MGLVDQINANTAGIVAGKLAVERALRDKGVQVTPDGTTLPTFDQLTTAVEGMQVISDVTGVEDVAIFANEDLPKGTVCSLAEARGSFQAILAEPNLPTSAKVNDTTTTPLDALGKDEAYANPLVMARGKIVMVPSYQYGNYYAFYLKNNKYVQLKVDGSYSGSRFDVRGSEPCRECYAFDVVTNRLYITNMRTLYIYRLDEENLNLVSEHSVPFSGSNYNYVGQTIYAHNGNLIYNKYTNLSTYSWTILCKYNPETPSLTETSSIRAGFSTASYVSNIVIDLTTDIGDGKIYCVVCEHNTQSKTSKIAVQKLVYDESSGMYTCGKYTSTINIKFLSGQQSRTYGYGYKANAQISLSGSLLYTLDVNNKLHMYSINTDTMALTEVPVVFADNLDYSKIEAFALVKGANYLYVLSTDTDLAEDERLRLYKYDVNSSSWVFVACPVKDTFEPRLYNNTLPAIATLISGKNTLAKSADGYYRLYDVGETSLAFDYYASNAHNKLVLGATDYGITNRDIKKGEVDNVAHILSGQSDVMVSAINASIDESIGGAY
jgi:hypothetical protein